jgi:electron transfer flavoprotein alpha subunit
MILVVAEQRGGNLNRATWETIAGAQQLTAVGPIVIAVIGSGVTAVAAELAGADVQQVVSVDHPALELYTPDAYTVALEQLVGNLSPSLIVFSHTYQTRDLVPKLAARLDRTLVTDVTAVRQVSGEIVCTRPMFQGKLVADIVPQGPPPHIVTFQIGAFRADQSARGAVPARVERVTVDIDAAAIREKPEPPFQETRQAVDLSQWRKDWLTQSAQNSRPQGRFAIRGGCRWRGRLAARVRLSPRSCMSPSGSPVRSSTWSG